MDLKCFLFAVYIATFFTGWPNTSKALGVDSGISTSVIVFFTLMAVVVGGWKGLVEINSISLTKLMIIIAIGIGNGIAVHYYGVITSDKTVQTGMFLVTVGVLQMVFAPGYDHFLYHINPTKQQWLGLAGAIPVIWLLAQGHKQI